MENKTENTDKKSTTTNKNAKIEENRWNMLGRKGKATKVKRIIQLVERNQRVLAKERRLK